MPKETIKKAINCDFLKLDTENRLSIKSLKDIIGKLEKLGATHIEIEPYRDFDGIVMCLNAYTIIIETDEECRKRLAAEEESENKRKLEAQQAEINLLKELQQKYPNL